MAATSPGASHSIERAGFETRQLDTYHFEGEPKTMGYTYEGVAVSRWELSPSHRRRRLSSARDCRLVDFRAEGRQSFYFVAQPALLDLLRAAENLLADTGEAVTLCPVFGVDSDGTTS